MSADNASLTGPEKLAPVSIWDRPAARKRTREPTDPERFLERKKRRTASDTHKHYGEEADDDNDDEGGPGTESAADLTCAIHQQRVPDLSCSPLPSSPCHLSATSRSQQDGALRGAILERLPAELLERIFLLSENVALARASPSLGLRLSPRSCLTALLVAALAPTWDCWFGCQRRKVQSYHGWAQDVDRVGGSWEFQSDVLACSWLTLDLVLAAQQIWYTRRGRGRHYQHTDDFWPSLLVEALSSPPHPPPPPPQLIPPSSSSRLLPPPLSTGGAAAAAAATVISNRHPAPRHPEMLGGLGDNSLRGVSQEVFAGFDLGGFDHGEDVRACFEADWFQFRRMSPFSGSLPSAAATTAAFVRMYSRMVEADAGSIDVHPAARIPDRLLGSPGPRSWADVQLLFWLVRAGARLAPGQTWELTKRGYENVLLLDDEDLAAQTVQVFAILGVFHKADHWPGSLLNDKWWDSARALDQIVGVGVHGRRGTGPAPGSVEMNHGPRQGAQKYSSRFWNFVRNLLQYELVVRNRITGSRGRAPRSCRFD